MAESKFMLVNLEDAKSKELAQVISSDTARKILNLLSDKPLSETDISKKLNIPLPTAHYNIQQLLKSEIIEVKGFLWSEKGKKIQHYQLSNKLIIIAPRNSVNFVDKLKEILPITLGGALISLGIYSYQLLSRTSISKGMIEYTEIASESAPQMLAATPRILEKASSLPNFINYALWFFLGVTFATLLYILVTYLRSKLK